MVDQWPFKPLVQGSSPCKPSFFLQKIIYISTICVYILKWDRLYVGSTSNLERRITEHRRGKTHSTKRIWDWDLFAFLECESLEVARKIERHIKSKWHYEDMINIYNMQLVEQVG